MKPAFQQPQLRNGLDTTAQKFTRRISRLVGSPLWKLQAPSPPSKAPPPDRGNTLRRSYIIRWEIFVTEFCLSTENQKRNNRRGKEDHEYHKSFCQQRFVTASRANRLFPAFDPALKPLWSHFRTIKEFPTLFTIIFSDLSKLQFNIFRVVSDSPHFFKISSHLNLGDSFFWHLVTPTEIFSLFDELTSGSHSRNLNLWDSIAS